MSMGLPTKDAVSKLLSSSRTIRQRVHAIARRLEALNEYNPEQALLVAADIVRSRLLREDNETKGVAT